MNDASPMHGGSKSPHHEIMAGLPSRHAPLVDLIGDRNAHYVDLPAHGNIGDLLIMLGTIAFFRKNNIRNSVRAPYFGYNPAWASTGDVIVFHGGGNLGDLYSGPQEFREAVVSRRTDLRIIILPQTVHFRSAERAEQCRRTFRRHPDLHICVRDRKSLALVQEMSDNVHLMPDMAHHLWQSQALTALPPGVRSGRLGLFRTDDESTGRLAMGVTEVSDWPQQVGLARTLAIACADRAVRMLHALRLNSVLLRQEMALWEWCANRLATEAVSLLNGKAEIVTDRLHGHILACLLSVPNEVVDNDYGKNSSYVAEWTGRSELVKLIS